MNVFRRRTVFKLLTTKVHRSYQKSFFGENAEKRLVNGKISQFRYERIHWHMDSRIPDKFCGIGKAEVTKNGCVVFITKKGWYFAPFSGFYGAISPKNMGSHFPHSSFLFQVLSKSVQFSRR